MMHRYCFEALDRSLRDVMRFSTYGNLDLPFGGKVVVFGGDFRQILPVVPKGSRQDVVYVSLSSSSLWSSCKVLKLTKNMRLQLGSSATNVEDVRQFSKWILNIGDGVEGGPNDGEVNLELPDDILKKKYKGPYCLDCCQHISILRNTIGQSSIFQRGQFLHLHMILLSW
ncbi:hypothetical protein RND81_03G002400 [Saponaria officinalis]|uniref:ATP-dependent DNA helicase n=1 Tax=Saponaria officinalis TaxID=3572 RepID=A0AAW1M2R0_SAPOF